MSTPRLNEEQSEKANKFLDKIRKEIFKLAKGDENLIFAYRRKIRKRLEFDERSTPAQRKKLKDLIWKNQKGICDICKRKIKKKYSELHKIDSVRGYIEDNVRLVCHDCHIEDQIKKEYK